MLAYMEQKYGEPFRAMEPYGGQFGKDYTMLRVRAVKRKEEGILVRAWGREETVYQDNYLAYLLREDIEQRLSVPAEAAFGKCRVFYRIPELVFPADFPADMDVDAFLRHPQSQIKVYIYVRNFPQKVRKQAEYFFSLLKKEGYVLGGVLSYPADEEMYEMITEENFTGDIYQGYQSAAEAVFSMNEKGEVVYLEWKGAALIE